jgi:glycosyltransferase involved in cell wall biosynthesis
MDTVELKDVGVRHETLYRVAGAVATRMLLLSNSVSVLMPGYRKILNDKYGRDNVHLRAHGLLARRPEFPDFSRRGNPVHQILAFGKWGTYKRLELMIEAFGILASKMPNVRLVVGGGDHPQAAGYIQSMKQQYAGDPRIEFRGYVQEDDLADLFQTSSVAVMPYSSSTGCSGVAHLACAFGVPIISADIPDFRQMAQSEELAIDFYPSGNAEGLAECLFQFLNDPEKQRNLAMQNFSAALRMTMPNVVQKYLRHFEIQQRVQTLRHISRIRRLPRWIPSKSLLLRLMTRNRLSWARRSVVLHTPWSEIPPGSLLNRNGNGRGKLNGSSIPVNGDDVGLLGTDAIGRAISVAPARQSAKNNGNHGAGPERLDHSPAIDLATEKNPEHAEADQPIGEKETPSLASVRSSGYGSGTDSEEGRRAIDARGNGARAE